MADLANVSPDLAGAIQAMIAASGGRITITSGYRTYDQQAQLYKQEPNLAAPPGHSNHEKGLAVDLGGDIALAHQLAPRFGLSFPMSWEPWHVELVSTRATSQPTAYTPSPNGSPNPTQDNSIAQQPDHVLATMVDATRTLRSQDKQLVDIQGPLGSSAPLGSQQEPLGHQSGPPQAAPGSDTSAPGPAPAATTVSATGGNVNPADLYKKLIAQGVDPVHAAALVAIAGRESGYNAGAHNGNAGTGDNSYGLFQINLINGEHSQFSPDQLTSVDGSVAAAAQMVRSGGLQPWGPYKGQSWSYGTNLANAAAASGGQVTVQQLEAIANEGLH